MNACNYGRHWPVQRRAELAAAFGVPPEIEPHFGIIRGWQITKWTWPAASPIQTNYLPALRVDLGRPARSNYHD